MGRAGIFARRRCRTVELLTVEACGAPAQLRAAHLSRGLRVVVDAEFDWRERTDQQVSKGEVVTSALAASGSRAA